jgi:hypothetical protein
MVSLTDPADDSKLRSLELIDSEAVKIRRLVAESTQGKSTTATTTITTTRTKKPRMPSEPKYICCLRDLTGEDLPWLQKFRADVLRFIQDIYGYPSDQVHIFAHYPSSARYSTLHFHNIFGARFQKFAQKLERPHQLSRQFSLEGIIKSLQEDPAHFQTCALEYFLGDKADLMDPISAFFECSPHRYLHDFTFEWDPSALQQKSSVPVQSTKSEVGDVALSNQVSQQLRELRLNVGTLKQSIDELRELVKDVAKNQRLEHQGASRLALLQLANLPESTSSPNLLANLDDRHVFAQLSLLVAMFGIGALVSALIRKR